MGKSRDRIRTNKHSQFSGRNDREAHSPASAPPEEKSIVSRNRAGEGVNKPSSPRHADSFAPVYRRERSLRLRAGGRQRLATTRRATADRHAARCASRDLCSGGAPRRYTPSQDSLAASPGVSPEGAHQLVARLKGE